MGDFTFTPEQLITFKAAAKERYKLSSPTILMVEDQPFFQQLLQEMLSRNFTLDIASNIADAMDIYAEIAPCIVFLDIELPDGSGHELAQVLRRYDPDAYIVMVTGNSHTDDIKTAKDNHVQGFIVKPYNRQRITQVLDQYRKLRQPLIAATTYRRR